MARPIPSTNATPTASHGTPTATSSRPPASTTISATDEQARGDPADRADPAGHAGLDHDRAPDLAAGHPGRAQDADLADALEHVHRERVDDAERRDDDRDEGERVEQAEDTVERLADRALDPPQGHRLQGQRAGRVVERGAVRGGGGRAEAHGERIRTRDAESLGVGPADDHRLARPPGQRPFGDADDAQRDDRAVGRGGRQDVADGAGRRARRCPSGTMTAPPASSAARAADAVADDEPEPAVGGEIGADHRRAVGPDAVEREVEGRDRADGR